MPVLATQKLSGTCVLLCLELYQVGVEICWVICAGIASFLEWYVHVTFELHVRLHCVSDDIVNNYELQNARREAVSRWLSSTASDKIKKEIQEAKYKVCLSFCMNLWKVVYVLYIYVIDSSVLFLMCNIYFSL